MRKRPYSIDYLLDSSISSITSYFLDSSISLKTSLGSSRPKRKLNLNTIAYYYRYLGHLGNIW